MRNVLFRLHQYQVLVSTFFMASDIDLKQKKEKITQAQGKLLRKVEGGKELDISQWRRYADVSLLQFRKMNVRRRR